MIERYIVYYQNDFDPLIRRSCIVDAVDGRHAIDRFYDIYNMNIYTAIGSGKLKDNMEKKEEDQSMTERITYLVTYLEHGKTKTCKVTGRDASVVAGFMNCHHPCATTLSVEPLSTNTNKKGETKMDLTKKITVNLTEDDIKEIIAEYVRKNAGMTAVKAENVEFVYGVNTRGTGCNIQYDGCLKECKVKC